MAKQPKSGPVTVTRPSAPATQAPAAPMAQVAAVLAPAAPATQAPAAPAAPAHVALRGGQAVALVRLAPGAVYRTKAPHNVAWWASITQACATGPAPVATLCGALPAGAGVPTHFVGYCLRRGYLVAGAAPAQPAVA